MAEIAAAAKAQGNELFRAEKFEEAIACYTTAIQATPEEAALYSNRAACYAGLEQWTESAADARFCIIHKPDWAKGYYRRALALSKLEEWFEARHCCELGLKLDNANKELKTVNDRVTTELGRFFVQNSGIDKHNDPRSDYYIPPPTGAFKEVFKGKVPAKDCDLNEKYARSERTLLHVAVLIQAPKVVKELVKRGASLTVEDRMGLTPLHLAAMVQNEMVWQALGEDGIKLQPLSSVHHATPQDIAAAVRFYEASDFKVRVVESWSATKVDEWDRHKFSTTIGAFGCNTSKWTPEYCSCVLSSVLDEEGAAELAKECRARFVPAALSDSGWNPKLVLAKMEGELGWGVFAAEPFDNDEYIAGVYGVITDEFSTEQQKADTSGLIRTKKKSLDGSQHAFGIMPQLPFRTNAEHFRSLGAFVNHSSEPNGATEHMLARGVPMIVIYANRKIEAGEQILIDYTGRLAVPAGSTAMPLQLPDAIKASLQ